MSMVDEVCGDDSGASSKTDDAPSAAARSFVRTPFTVRRNVVKVWRPVPPGIWFALNTPPDHDLSSQRERRAAIAMVILVILLLFGIGSVGYRTDTTSTVFPVIGKSHATPSSIAAAPAGWYFQPAQSWVLVAWVIAPSLLSWIMMRYVWLPATCKRNGAECAALALAGHLLSVYMYVYIMIAAGAVLMPILILMSPRGTETFRWCFWLFLFGESFFVPAVMWSRFIIADRDGAVFGRFRWAGLMIYLVLFVVIPIAGMVPQLG